MIPNDKLANRNTVWHEPTVRRADREKQNGHQAAILWFTGLSGSGKSTPACTLPPNGSMLMNRLESRRRRCP